MNPHRILISGGLAVGGPQTHVALLCRVLRDAGAEVTIVAASTNWPRAALDDLKAMGVQVVVSPFGHGAFKALGNVYAFLLWPFLLRRDYDVLYCVGVGRMHQWAGKFVRAGAPKIYHEIVECLPRHSGPGQFAAAMDGLIANSAVVAENMACIFDGIPLRTIPFLTSSAPMKSPARTATPQILRVAFLGRLAPHKRPMELIEAWPEWNARVPIGPARLDFYGGDYDGEAGRLRTRVNALGLQNSVRVHGAYTTAHLPQIFAETDLVVLPSRYEGLPLVLVEAMQRGIPVVATSAGGTAELGDDNPDVLITEGTGWAEFATGLETLAQRLRAGEIDSARLHEWTESRYGFAPVADLWRQALLRPTTFFADKANLGESSRPVAKVRPRG